MSLAEIKEFLQPGSDREAVELLALHGERAVILGGGTFLHGLAARGLFRKIDTLIDLQKTGLSFVKVEGEGLVVGSTTTFAALAATEIVRTKPEFGALLDALRYPPPQICNLATVGGCVAAAAPLFDLPIALMALDGSVKALGPRGSREIELHKFYLDYFEHVLERTELLTQVVVAKQPFRSGSAFLKLETNANDLALLNVGARVTLDEEGTCRDVRVVVGGGVGKVPVRAVSCEDALKGQRPTMAVLRESGNAVSSDIRAVSDHRTSAKYRTTVAKVFVRRALLRALSRVGVQLDEPGGEGSGH